MENMIRLSSGETPFADADNQQVRMDLIRGAGNTSESHHVASGCLVFSDGTIFSSAMLAITSLLTADPTERPKASDVRDSSWLFSIRRDGPVHGDD